MRDALVKWFLRLYATAMSFAALVWLWRHFPWGLVLLAVAALLITRTVNKERRRRQREGYWLEYISLREDTDEFVVVYHEGDKQYFFSGKIGQFPTRRVLRVPNPTVWPSQVPAWMGERRDLILERIRQNPPVKGLEIEVAPE